MGHQYLLESNYSCLWKHVENNLFLSNFMKISSPSLNIFYNLFYFRGFFPTLSSSLEYSFFYLESIAQVLCRKASATRIPCKDHWH